MNFEQISFFMTCASCLNFSLAAKYHFVSVSTLSRNINSLEDELGVKLFNRGFHGHEITEAGERFFDLCANYSMKMNNYLMNWSCNEKDCFFILCRSKEPFKKLVACCASAPMEQFSKNIQISFVNDSDLSFALDTGFADALLLDEDSLRQFAEYKYIDFYSENNIEYRFAVGPKADAEVLNELIGLKKYLK